jgi:hypothetical protein
VSGCTWPTHTAPRRPWTCPCYSPAADRPPGTAPCRRFPPGEGTPPAPVAAPDARRHRPVQDQPPQEPDRRHRPGDQHPADPARPSRPDPHRRPRRARCHRRTAPGGRGPFPVPLRHHPVRPAGPAKSCRSPTGAAPSPPCPPARPRRRPAPPARRAQHPPRAAALGQRRRALGRRHRRRHDRPGPAHRLPASRPIRRHRPNQHDETDRTAADSANNPERVDPTSTDLDNDEYLEFVIAGYDPDRDNLDPHDRFPPSTKESPERPPSPPAATDPADDPPPF